MRASDLGPSENQASLFTDLLFSQMIVERANENQNRGRLMTANATGRGGGWVNEKIERSFFSPAPYSHLRARFARALIRLIFGDKSNNEKRLLILTCIFSALATG